ncbi:hypothetical protein IWQ62_001796 [Dispira parvispora]|uniref:YTH domain-containing protein n=1 Tax=Dispira parvispora TaxID=1520584 RepID=A0A9W8ARS0_9FUNG|nr:hypothetical protein IWQ62_001796 [Dispira parvispora]
MTGQDFAQRKQRSIPTLLPTDNQTDSLGSTESAVPVTPLDDVFDRLNAWHLGSAGIVKNPTNQHQNHDPSSPSSGVVLSQVQSEPLPTRTRPTTFSCQSSSDQPWTLPKGLSTLLTLDSPSSPDDTVAPREQRILDALFAPTQNSRPLQSNPPPSVKSNSHLESHAHVPKDLTHNEAGKDGPDPASQAYYTLLRESTHCTTLPAGFTSDLSTTNDVSPSPTKGNLPAAGKVDAVNAENAQVAHTPQETTRQPEALATSPVRITGPSVGNIAPSGPLISTSQLYSLGLVTDSTSFDIQPPNARYFVIKSNNELDVRRSLKHGIWASTDLGNKRLDKAYYENLDQGGGPIYLFYSVNASGKFCGVAQMTSPVDLTKKSLVWAQDKWNGIFAVKWLFVKDIANCHLRHILLSNHNNKPLTNSRDTQELLEGPGQLLLRMFCDAPSCSGMLQDYIKYSDSPGPAPVPPRRSHNGPKSHPPTHHQQPPHQLHYQQRHPHHQPTPWPSALQDSTARSSMPHFHNIHEMPLGYHLPQVQTTIPPFPYPAPLSAGLNASPNHVGYPPSRTGTLNDGTDTTKLTRRRPTFPLAKSDESSELGFGLPVPNHTFHPSARPPTLPTSATSHYASPLPYSHTGTWS